MFKVNPVQRIPWNSWKKSDATWTLYNLLIDFIVQRAKGIIPKIVKEKNNMKREIKKGHTAKTKTTHQSVGWVCAAIFSSVIWYFNGNAVCYSDKY